MTFHIFLKIPATIIVYNIIPTKNLYIYTSIREEFPVNNDAHFVGFDLDEEDYSHCHFHSIAKW